MPFPPVFCPSPNSERDAPPVKPNGDPGARDGVALRKGTGTGTVGRQTACDELRQMEFNFSEAEDSMRS